MIAYLRGFFARILAKPYYLALSVGLTAFFIFVALLVSATAEPTLRVAYLADGDFPVEVDAIEAVSLDAEPRRSELVLGDYDVVVEEVDGRYEAESLKNVEYEAFVLAALAGEDVEGYFADETPRAVRIMGFAVVVLLLQAFFYIDLFIEDKKNGALARVMSSPRGLGSYLVALTLYAFFIVFGVAMVVLAIFRWGFNQDVGMPIPYYAIPFALTTLLGIAFSLFSCALIEVRDNAAALFAAVVLFTSILSGSFGALNVGGFLQRVMDALPQRHVMELSDALAGDALPVGHAAAVLAPIVLFFALAGWLIRAKLRAGRY